MSDDQTDLQKAAQSVREAFKTKTPKADPYTQSMDRGYTIPDEKTPDYSAHGTPAPDSSPSPSPSPEAMSSKDAAAALAAEQAAFKARKSKKPN